MNDTSLSVALRKLASVSTSGTVRPKDATRVGVTLEKFYRLKNRGDLIEVTRGVYQLSSFTTSKSDFSEQLDFVGACSRLGLDVFVTGPTALAHYSLIDVDSAKLWLSVPLTMRTREKLYRLIRTSASPKIGVVQEEGYRIASVERAIVDTLRLKRIFSRELGFAAANNAIRGGKTNQQKLLDCARKVGVSKAVIELLLMLRPEAFAVQ